MSQLTRLAVTIAALAFIAQGAVAAEPAPTPTHDRLYLLADDTDVGSWSVDRFDPEMRRSRVDRTCSSTSVHGVRGYAPCQITFLPGSLLEAPLAWGPSRPLRFRLGLEVASRDAFTVQLRVESPTGSWASAPATETAPGVWEGKITAPGIASNETWTLLSLVVEPASTTWTTGAAVTFRAAGASYVDLPDPVPARPVARLLAESPRPEPAAPVLETPLRSFRFNDDAWSATSFEGDLEQRRAFDVTIAEDARFVIAWVELFDAPFVHDLLRGREPDTRKLTDSPQLDILRDGEMLARGANTGVYGLGMDAAVAMDVPAGPLTLDITPTTVWPTGYQQGHPYTVHLLAVHGDRTLASMRWVSMFADYPGLGPTNAPFIARCPGTPFEMVPVPEEVTTWKVDLDHHTVAPTSPAWTLSFFLPPNSYFLCGDVGTADTMRFTYPDLGVARVGAMVAPGETYSEWRATVFEFEVTFSYTPPPPPDEDPV